LKERNWDKVGRKPHQMEIKTKKEVEEWVISQLESNPKRWHELWKEGKKEKKFTSTRYLTAILDLLVEKRIINRIKNSYKDISYSLTDDFAELRMVLGQDWLGKKEHKKTIETLKSYTELTTSSIAFFSFYKINIMLAMIKLILSFDLKIKTRQKYYEQTETMILELLNQLTNIMKIGMKKDSNINEDAIKFLNYETRKEMDKLQILSHPHSLVSLSSALRRIWEEN